MKHQVFDINDENIPRNFKRIKFHKQIHRFGVNMVSSVLFICLKHPHQKQKK